LKEGNNMKLDQQTPRADSSVSIPRREALKKIGGGIGLLGLGMAAWPDDANGAWPRYLRAGDVFVTRNRLGRNPVPGWWNHTAVFTGTGVVEGQVDPGKVIYTPFREFYGRYPTIRVLRLRDTSLIRRFLQYARWLKGKRYSVLPVSGGYSCVMVVRASFYFGTRFRRDPWWLVPDDVAISRHFVRVGDK